ncbi:hypothetical protein HMPREF2607_00545 [Streptococcus sp. HMSC078H03]|jgi:hypothetical protein|uniref:Abi family protein n=1 Tax=Streptococcus TaxID=1301 RepID=UPI0008A1103A|nr:MULTISPECIES: Abi family protein [Streptococcus]OFO02193.1 hypothetical protein HMPREF2607_00545 [Streptococcus sp. HMSC078H03]
MARQFSGTIEEVFNNYGTVSTLIGGTKVSFFFFITPDMLYKGKYLKMARKVTFRLINSQIRDVKVKIATDLCSCPGEKIKKFKISKKDITDVNDYHAYIFQHFYKVTDTEILDEIIDKDIELKEVILKWVLKMEKNIKSQLTKLLMESSINSSEFYEALGQNNSLNPLKNKIFKILKSRYMFRAEFELFKIDKTDNNDAASIKLVDVPLTLFFENLTIDELSKVYSYVIEFFHTRFNNESDSYKFLIYSKQMFAELSIIRNASAHGNPLIPTILDDSYSPSFLFDLKSVWPHHNSGNNVEEEWELFHAIRWSTRMLAKDGIAPIYAGSPQLTALYISKYILINPARRSFFSFLFVVLCYFRFINIKERESFYHDFSLFMIIPEHSLEDEVENNIFFNYPKDNSVMKQIFIFTYVLFSDEFWLYLPLIH